MKIAKLGVVLSAVLVLCVHGLKSLQSAVLIAGQEQPLPSAAQQKTDPPVSKGNEQLRQLLQERRAVLLERLLLLDVEADIGRLRMEEISECVRGLLETDDASVLATPERKQLLQKCVEYRTTQYEFASQCVEVGTASLESSLRAKALLLEARIWLLRVELSQSQNPAQPESSAAADTAIQRPEKNAVPKAMDAETRALCEERRKLLREAIQQNAAARGPGRQETGADFSLYRSWVDSELELAETQQEKERLIQAYVEQVQFVVNYQEAAVRAERASTEGLVRARIALVEAKLFQRRFLSGSN